MYLLFLVPLAAAVIAMPIVKRAPVQGAFLAAWSAMTFLCFAPCGLLASLGYLDRGNPGGLLIIVASLSGFVASFKMLGRLSHLYRGDALGSSRYLVCHHAAVVLAFFVAELVSGGDFNLTAFCLVACGIGALIVGYDKAKLPFARENLTQEPRPVAF